MDAVNAFNHELFSLMDMKPPISRAKMISITKSAIKAMKLYKHVVQIVEKFIKKCKPEYKVAGLYVVDSIVRQSRHQFGVDKDVFGPRFTKNITGTFENLCLCPTEERSKIVRVLNLWQKNGVFKMEIIQPLLDMAISGSSSAAAADTEMDDPDPGFPSSPSPVKGPVTSVTENTVVAPVPQLQNSDAFAAVAQLFQSSKGQQLQQMLQNFQQIPLKPQTHPFQTHSHPHVQPHPQAPPHPQPHHQAPPHPQPHLQAPTHPQPHLQAPPQPQPHHQAPPQPQPHHQAPPHPQPHHQAPPHPQPHHQAPPHPPPHLQAPPHPQPHHQAPPHHQAHPQPPANLHHLHSQPHLQTLTPAAQRLPLPSSEPTQQKTAFDKVATLLDRFDYDDEPEGADESKKHQTSFTQQPPGFPQHFQQHMMGMVQDLTQQIPLPPNGQLQGYGLLPGQAYPGMVGPPGQPLPGTAPPGFPGGYPPNKDAFGQHVGHQEQDMNMDLDPPSMKDGRHRPDGRKSPSGSRSPKRRRSRSNSRTQRSRNRRSRSRSRDRRRHSPRSRSQERREREKEKEKERERRQKGLPQPKADTLSVCSTTLWVGQLDKRTQQQDVACLLEEFGQIDSINMIPPRGCAYIVMVHRQDAFRALQKLSRGSYKVNQKAIKIAWALNKGIKAELKQYWDVELGVTFIPWSKIRQDQLEDIREGGTLDPDTLDPEWRSVQSNQDTPEEFRQNGRSEPLATLEDTAGTAPVATPVQVHPVQVQSMGGVGSLQQHPSFPPGPGPPGGPPMGLPPPSFPPGVPPGPPPSFMRPGPRFNPMQMMPPGFLPPGSMPLGPSGPPPSAAGVVGGVELSLDPAGLGNQVPGPPVGSPGGPIPLSGGLLGARPGMIPLQRPPVHSPGPVLPPPHMQRFPPPHGGPHGPHPPRGPPHHNMPPQMMPPNRGPHPHMMHHDGPPPPPGGPRGFGMGMPPSHPMRGPFPPHGPLPGGPPPPFMRGGPRGPEGPEEIEGRGPPRGERPGFRDRDPDRERERDWERDRERERFGGGGRRFGDGGRGGGGWGERMEERERFGGWQEDGGEPRGGGGWERDRDRRDWRERRSSPDGERERGRGGDGESERGRSAGGERERGRGSEVGERGRGEVGERGLGERERGRGEVGERGVGERGVGERGRGRGDVGERGVGERGRGRGDVGERGVGERGVGERGRGGGVVGERGLGERGRGRGEVGERGLGERGRGRGEVGERGVGERGRGRGERGLGERGRGRGEVGERGIGERGRGEVGERGVGERGREVGERGRGGSEGGEGERQRRPRNRERTSRWDTDDRLGDKAEVEPENVELKLRNSDDNNTETLPPTTTTTTVVAAAATTEPSKEPPTDSKDSTVEPFQSQQKVESEPSGLPVEVTGTEPRVACVSGSTSQPQPIEKTHADETQETEAVATK
ncbi:SR-related and CTD-associated factor 4 isoform X2 [Salvelinus fontinalis]|uniref:SR-related and CTD-associated factor 4 isoform X2 n=1 Tax=Salvelinus fontinalis TaxID=8038 RepID=UPI002485398A|nr:SR-related and CTD-associated factor 4 isoform X2 [Salvelinus fontinalis]